jgi:hypothetical protein
MIKKNIPSEVFEESEKTNDLIVKKIKSLDIEAKIPSENKELI